MPGTSSIEASKIVISHLLSLSLSNKPTAEGQNLAGDDGPRLRTP
jgi:hypothetical protein